MKILNNKMEKVTVIILNENNPGKPRIVKSLESGKEAQFTLKTGDKIILN